MPVKLRVKRYGGQAPVAELSCTIDNAGTLGRAADNDLVLADPSKYISRKHAAIERSEEGYYLVDTGSNPSVLNDHLLGQGHKAQLQTGDVLEIGDYQIDVELCTSETCEHDEVGVGSLKTLAVFMPTPGVGLKALPLPLPELSIFEPPPERIELLDLGRVATGVQAPLLEMPRQAEYAGARSDHLSPERQALPQLGAQPLHIAEAALIPEGYDALADLVTPGQDQARSVQTAHAVDQSLPSDCRVLRALLEGLGLPRLQVTRGPEGLARLVGEMLREATGATMGMLLARAMVKRESNVEMTLIGALANNPLKFFPDPGAALNQMLGEDSPAYLPGVQALRAAFDDLKVHEKAVDASLRETLGTVLRCFEPAVIARGLPAKGLLERLRPAKRKARLWACYTRRYEAVVGEGGGQLQRLIGKQFSTAYPLQVSRLSDMP